MKNRKSLNIYDMTKVAMIGTKFYEQLHSHRGKQQYRVMDSIGGDHDYITDQTVISKLDKIFKGEGGKDEK